MTSEDHVTRRDNPEALQRIKDMWKHEPRPSSQAMAKEIVYPSSTVIRETEAMKIKGRAGRIAFS